MKYFGNKEKIDLEVLSDHWNKNSYMSIYLDNFFLISSINGAQKLKRRGLPPIERPRHNKGI